MGATEIVATCNALAVLADELDNRVPIVSAEAVARLVRLLAVNEDARILFNGLVLLARASVEDAG